jgi:hypothetical protein
LTEAEKLVLLKLCKTYSRVYLDNKPMTQFWRLVSTEFKKATKDSNNNLNQVVLGLVGARIQHISACGTGTEPEGGDLNLAIDAWILVIRERDQIKKTQKEKVDEILAAKEASEIARENMKKSLSNKKRAREESSSDGDSDSNEEDELLFSSVPVAVLAADIAENSTPSSANSSNSSSAPTRSKKRKKRSPKRSHLRNEMQPFFEALSGGIEKIGRNKEDEKAIEDRLSKIETKLEKAQVELKSSMSAILQAITQNRSG